MHAREHPQELRRISRHGCGTKGEAAMNKPLGVPLRPDFSSRPRASVIFREPVLPPPAIEKRRARRQSEMERRRTAGILCSAQVPATTTGSGWANTLATAAVGDFIASLAPISARATRH